MDFLDLLKLFGVIVGFLVGGTVLFLLSAFAFSVGPIVGTFVLIVAIALYVTALIAAITYAD